MKINQITVKELAERTAIALSEAEQADYQATLDEAIGFVAETIDQYRDQWQNSDSMISFTQASKEAFRLDRARLDAGKEDLARSAPDGFTDDGLYRVPKFRG